MTIRDLLSLVLLVGSTLSCLSSLAQAQDQNRPAPTITVQSNLVLVPTQVRSKKGETIYGLGADDFTIEVDGTSQQVRLDPSESTGALSLVVLVQCSRNTWREMTAMRGLESMVGALVGAGAAQVAVVDFGAELELLTGLTSSPEKQALAFERLQPCPEDTGAGILDALTYANHLLDRDHAIGRRIILLVSEERDHGSKAKPESVIYALNRSNTVVHAMAFSPASSEVGEDLKTSDGATGGILGILGSAIQALRKNIPKELCRETGGDYATFRSGRAFDQDLNTLANRVHGAYQLSFVPHLPLPTGQDAPALHAIKVQVPKYPDAVLRYRANYFKQSELATDDPH